METITRYQIISQLKNYFSVKELVCNHDDARQRGLRCNLCEKVKSKTVNYLSGHIFGKAGEFTVTGMDAVIARHRIKAAAHLLPYPIRLENGVSWLHFDVMDTDDDVQPKITEFFA